MGKNCSSDLKIFANSQPSALSLKSFSRSLKQFICQSKDLETKYRFNHLEKSRSFFKLVDELKERYLLNVPEM